MTSNVLTFLDSEGRQVQWQSFDEQGRISEQQQCALTGLQPQEKPLVVLIPSSEILATTVQAPKLSSSKLALALPALLEQQVADDISQMHLAFTQVAGGDVQVLALAHQRMKFWLDLLRQHQLQAQLLTADFYALPYQKQQWTVRQQQQTLQVRYAEQKGFALETESALELIQSLSEQPESVVESIQLWQQDEDSVTFSPSQLTVNTTVTDGADQVLTALTAITPINLLQGQYQRKKNWWGMIKPWRLPLASVLAAVIVALGVMVYKPIFYQQQLTQTDQAISSVMSKLWPGMPVTDDLSLRLSRAADFVGVSKSDSDFFNIFPAAIDSVNKVTAIDIQEIVYHDNELKLKIKFTKGVGIANLKTQLQQDKLRFQVSRPQGQFAWVTIKGEA